MALGAISVAETAVGAGRGPAGSTQVVDPMTDPLYLGFAWANLAAAIIGYSLLGFSIGRAGAGPGRAAFLAATSLAVSMVASVLVEELLIAETPYYFFPPLGFSVDYLAAFGVALNLIIFAPAAALLSAGCAWIARRRRRADASRGGAR